MRKYKTSANMVRHLKNVNQKQLFFTYEVSKAEEKVTSNDDLTC